MNKKRTRNRITCRPMLLVSGNRGQLWNLEELGEGESILFDFFPASGLNVQAFVVLVWLFVCLLPGFSKRTAAHSHRNKLLFLGDERVNSCDLWACDLQIVDYSLN